MDKQNKAPRINHAMLPLEQKTKYVLDTKRKHSFKKFVVNNWLRAVVEDGLSIDEIDNKFLKAMHKQGAAIWLNLEGSFVYRPNIEVDPIELASDDKAKRVFCSLLKMRNVSFKDYGSGEKTIPADVHSKNLLPVVEEFTPFAPSEFYYDKGLWKRTSFRPTKYLQIERPTSIKFPQNIDKLIQHLCNYTFEYYEWFMNWLAGFFQSLRKSPVAVVIRGDQGSGKSLFFEHILTPLYGEAHCVVVDQARIESNFKNWIASVLFYNLNEVAVDMQGRKNAKNFLKQLITDPAVQTELKYTDASAVKIYGNVYITTNEALPVEIEPSDRRFTVFQSGCSLWKAGFNPPVLIEQIAAELEDFAKYLKTYKVDWKMYSTCLDTPEKKAIQGGTNSKLSLYVQAVLGKDISYFSDLNEIATLDLYKRIKSAFEESKIAQDDLISGYRTLYDVDHSSKKVMENIRMLEPVVFAKEKIKSSNGKKIIELPRGS